MQKSSLEHGTAEIIWWKSSLKQICFKFLTKGVCSLRRFNCNRELISVGAAAEKARFQIFTLVYGTKGCLETDDLWILEISQKCSRLTKYVSC